MAKKKVLNQSREEETSPRKKQRIIVNNVQPETKAANCFSCSPLPLDVLADILSRLPAKSIAKLRCVCKQWLSLTYNYYFLKLQHERSSSYMFINREIHRGKIKLYDLSIRDERKPTKRSYKLNRWRKHYVLSNSVDGLACAYAASPAKSNIYLVNPRTRELQKLQAKNVQKGFYLESVGLGIDMTIGQYKVVRLFSSYKSNYVHCEIYNVGTTQWRSLGAAPFAIWYGYNPVPLRGALYWIAKYNHQEEERMGLFRFDIKDEKFGSAISIPYPSFSHVSFCGLEESAGGKLWLIFRNHLLSYYELWGMKDYLDNTWVKEYKFHSDSLSSLRWNFYDSEFTNGELPLKLYEGGKWYVNICYNPHNRALYKFLDGWVSDGDFSFYRESLISPKKLQEGWK